MALEHRWRTQVQRNKHPKKGDYWLLSRASSGARESISLGYGLREEEAKKCEAGINFLVALRNASPVDLGPAPVDAREPFPYPGDGEICVSISPDYLMRVLREALTPAEKEVAQERVRGFLLKVAEESGRDRSIERAVRTTQEIARAARLGVEAGSLPLKLYHDQIFARERERARPRSWAGEKGNWQAHILPALGHVAVKDLDAPTFDRFISTFKLKDGSEPAPFTKRNVRGAYRALLNYAGRNGHRGDPHRFYDLRDATKRRRPIVPLTLSEIAALLRHAPSPMHRALFAFAFDEGPRPAEVARLTWRDVDFRTTKRAPYGSVRIAGTKTDFADSRVPLYAMARQYLLEWHAACGEPTDGPVFVWRGRPYSGQATYRRALKTAAKEAGITGKRIFPNLARHTAATTAAQAGVDVAQIAAQLRHSDTQMVRETYDLSGFGAKIDAGVFPDRREIPTEE